MASDGEEHEVEKMDLPESDNEDEVRSCVSSSDVIEAETVDDVTNSDWATPGDESLTSLSIAGTGKRTEEREEKHQPDFGQLPELVWVKVLQLLPLVDRYRLSQVSCLLACSKASLVLVVRAPPHVHVTPILRYLH